MTPGTRLGRYEIRSKIGEGGMGEVYQGRDTQLGRDVAVKVLPTTVSIDSDRLRRFEQEASAASALNHPNILVVHDIGTHDGTTYVVSELLEGETLRKRIGGTPMAQRRAIDYALQMAHGLAAAHEKGIIHRDLKPDNIFITNDGRVKILDFGLAKLTQLDGNQPQTNVPTRRVDTDPGAVMGTVGYMSPEQLKGRPVDQRTDIFSFGAILYEMLSGRRAFHGGSAAETMSAILKEDPPELSDTNKSVSPGLERLVNHCLEKNPSERFHSARDLAFALEALPGSGTASTQTATVIDLPYKRRHAREWLPWIVTAAAILFAVLALLWPYFRRPSTYEEGNASRFTIELPAKAVTIGPPVVSPDGRRLVYRLNTEDGKELLWIRPLESLDARPIAGTEGGTQPFWSPDSRSVGFFAGNKVKKVDLAGGAPQTLCDAPTNTGGTWGPTGVIVFAHGPGDGIYRVATSGGAPVRITQVNASLGELEHSWPQFLPDGRHFIYFARSAQPENSAIYVASLDDPNSRRLVQVHSSAAYASPGYILYVRDSTLVAQPFDAEKREFTGEAVPIAEDVARNPVNGRGFFSVSDKGILSLRTGGVARNQLMWFDRAGKQLEVFTSPGNYAAPALSPDEKTVAVSRVDFQTLTGSDIWLVDWARGAQVRFTTDPANDSYPVWSPSGDRIVFVSSRAGLTGIYQKLTNTEGHEEPLVASPESKISPQWSPDGRFILYSQINPTTNVDLLLLEVSGDRSVKPFLQTNFIEAQGRFSPDGRWVAYISNETGRFEVYIQGFPSGGAKVAVSTGGGSQPQWRSDGRELYYYTPDRKLMAVEVTEEGSTFKIGAARPLFELRISGAGIDRGFPGIGYYTVTRDGKRFVVAGSPDNQDPQQITVVVNWTADLKH